MTEKQKRYGVKYHDKHLMRWLRNARDPNMMQIFTVYEEAEKVASRLKDGKVIDLDSVEGVGLIMMAE